MDTHFSGFMLHFLAIFVTLAVRRISLSRDLPFPYLALGLFEMERMIFGQEADIGITLCANT